MSKANIASWERQGDIGVITLSNGKGNTLYEPVFVDLDELQKWTSEEGLKGIIIRGEGRNYSAGADLDRLREMAQKPDLLFDQLSAGKQILDFIESLNIPVVSAISGACFGGGLEIALASHIRICSPTALFAFPEVNYGLIPGMGGTKRLANLLGNRAYSMILDGDVVDGEGAKASGLIDYISDTKDVFGFAKEYLEKLIKDKPIEVIHSVIKSIRNASTLPSTDALIEETRLFIKLAKNLAND